MSADVTPDQALLLFGLLAVHGECAQAELIPAANKTDRESLEKAGLIAVKKDGRKFFLSLTDRGWDWTGANLSAELPPPQRALHELLGRLGEHFGKNGGSLASIIGTKPEKTVAIKPPTTKQKSAPKPAEDKKAAKAGKPKATAKITKPKSPTSAALRKRIEAAYLSLTGGRKNESVRLAHLRDELPDFDRATLDAALGRILKGDKKASLMRHDDPGQLGPADHAAAYSPAGEPFHVIWIAS